MTPRIVESPLDWLALIGIAAPPRVLAQTCAQETASNAICNGYNAGESQAFHSRCRGRVI
jgi:hypothetical protein